MNMENLVETSKKEVDLRSIASDWQEWFLHQWEKYCNLFTGKSDRKVPAIHAGTEVVPESAPASKTGSLSSRQLVSKIQQFMAVEYELRYNELRGESEFRPRNSGAGEYQPVTERDLNTIVLKAQEAGLPVWDRDIKRFVNSDRIPSFNPVDAFLRRLPAWDGKERIRQLADQVPVGNTEWRNRFYVWFLSMVAHWQGRDKEHANCSLPLLVGDQGCGKSTWCLNLLPPELREYYTDSIDLGKRGDAENYLNRFLLINIDEFDAVSINHQSFLKHILQKPAVQLRRPHQQVVRRQRRYASFVGTCNQFDLLTDTSGSRRYLCVEVAGQIRHGEPVEYEQLYAEALQALSSGTRYWFTRGEEAAIMGENCAFQQMPPAEQLFLRYFRPAEEGEEEAERLSAVEILQRLHKRASIKLPPTTITFFGRLLQRNKVTKIHTAKGNLYWVAEVA